MKYIRLNENEEEEKRKLKEKEHNLLEKEEATKEKFTGLTVLGQIDLADNPIKKFQQVASSDIKHPKSKRPRKRVTQTPDLTIINKNKER